MDVKKKDLVKNDIILRYANKSLRTLALSYKDIPFSNDYETMPEDKLENDLILICIAGIKDPLRPEIPEAIKKCKTAGIVVRMCTGDNINTAVAISKDAGILDGTNDSSAN